MKKFLFGTLVIMATLNSTYAMEKDRKSAINQIPHEEIVGKSIQDRITIQGICTIDHDIFFEDGGSIVIEPRAKLILGNKKKKITLYNLKIDSLSFADDSSQIKLVGDVILDFAETVCFRQGFIVIPAPHTLHLISDTPGISNFFGPRFEVMQSPLARIQWSKRHVATS
jgi:hypothetical protein